MNTKKIFTAVLTVITLFFLHMGTVLADVQNSPIGYWKTIDDVTGKPKAIVQIWQSSNEMLYGRIVKIYPRPGYDQNELCTACQGELHNQRIVGMVILSNLRQSKNNPNEWSGGEILDPKNGKSYHCNIKVIENGQKLNVRGYIGLTLFGRTQTWLKSNAKGA